MSNSTFNAAQDHFKMESGTSNALKVTSSGDNPSKQATSGANTFGDAAAVDSFGDTAAPTSEYDVVGNLVHTLASPKITLGSLIAANESGIVVAGSSAPVVVGTLRIGTSAGSTPKVTVSGQAVQSGASALRYYCVPAFTLSPRHRAQDFMSLCTIKKGNAVADNKTDYGLESVNGVFPIEFTLAQPKGELKNYDLHGGMATVDFAMNWFAETLPTILLASSITLRTSSASSNNTTTVTPTMSNPLAKECPEGGYVKYSWQVAFPLIGYEVS